MSLTSDVIECEFSVAGEGPALLLIHGIGAARNTWDKAMPLLQRHFKVVSYDLRGHGQSALPTCEFGLLELVADLESVRQRAGVEQAHVVGHSLGGMIGPAYALAFPQRVLSLGLLSTAAFRTADDSAKVLGVVTAMEKKGIPKVLETLTDRWFTDGFINTHPEVVENRLKQVLQTDPAIFLNVFRIYASTEMSPWLHQVNTPALVLTGELDGGCNPRLNRQIATALVNSELVILPGYKHSLLLEAGDVVAQHIVRFVSRLPADIR